MDGYEFCRFISGRKMQCIFRDACGNEVEVNLMDSYPVFHILENLPFAPGHEARRCHLLYGGYNFTENSWQMENSFTSELCAESGCVIILEGALLQSLADFTIPPFTCKGYEEHR